MTNTLGPQVPLSDVVRGLPGVGEAFEVAYISKKLGVDGRRMRTALDVLLKRGVIKKVGVLAGKHILYEVLTQLPLGEWNQ